MHYRLPANFLDSSHRPGSKADPYKSDFIHFFRVRRLSRKIVQAEFSGKQSCRMPGRFETNSINVWIAKFVMRTFEPGIVRIKDRPRGAGLQAMESNQRLFRHMATITGFMADESLFTGPEYALDCWIKVKPIG
jgi:hypothetical protein